MTPYRILVQAFKSLNKRQKDNLRYHLEKKTPIFCGPGSNTLFVSENGIC